MSADGTKVAYKWNGTNYVPTEIEEEPKFKSNKEYKEWLINQNSQTDGMMEKPSGV